MEFMAPGKDPHHLSFLVEGTKSAKPPVQETDTESTTNPADQTVARKRKPTKLPSLDLEAIQPSINKKAKTGAKSKMDSDSTLTLIDLAAEPVIVPAAEVIKRRAQERRRHQRRLRPDPTGQRSSFEARLLARSGGVQRESTGRCICKGKEEVRLNGASAAWRWKLGDGSGEGGGGSKVAGASWLHSLIKSETRPIDLPDPPPTWLAFKLDPQFKAPPRTVSNQYSTTTCPTCHSEWLFETTRSKDPISFIST